VRRIVFPLEGNLYGRSLSAAAPPHRFLPGAKGGLYSWKQAQSHASPAGEATAERVPFGGLSIPLRVH
jgi:hypothetical protein